MNSYILVKTTKQFDNEVINLPICITIFWSFTDRFVQLHTNYYNISLKLKSYDISFFKIPTSFMNSYNLVITTVQCNYEVRYKRSFLASWAYFTDKWINKEKLQDFPGKWKYCDILFRFFKFIYPHNNDRTVQLQKDRFICIAFYVNYRERCLKNKNKRFPWKIKNSDITSKKQTEKVHLLSQKKLFE